MYELKANYTILYFWDSGCGHCKKVTPKLLDFYAEYKDKGVEVYAIGTEFETEDWKKYVRNERPRMAQRFRHRQKPMRMHMT